MVRLTCSMCSHWQPARDRYVSACTSRKAGLGAVIQREGNAEICKVDFTPTSRQALEAHHEQ